MSETAAFRRARTYTVARNEKLKLEVDSKSTEIIVWIEETLKKPLPTHDLADSLMDGVLLCELIHAIAPQHEVIKYNPNARKKGAFACQENIKLFLQAAKALGVNNLFLPKELIERSNMTNVVFTLHSLARVAYRKSPVPTGKGADTSLLSLASTPPLTTSSSPSSSQQQQQRQAPPEISVTTTTVIANPTVVITPTEANEPSPFIAISENESSNDNFSSTHTNTSQQQQQQQQQPENDGSAHAVVPLVSEEEKEKERARIQAEEEELKKIAEEQEREFQRRCEEETKAAAAVPTTIVIAKEDKDEEERKKETEEIRREEPIIAENQNQTVAVVVTPAIDSSSIDVPNSTDSINNNNSNLNNLNNNGSSGNNFLTISSVSNSSSSPSPSVTQSDDSKLYEEIKMQQLQDEAEDPEVARKEQVQETVRRVRAISESLSRQAIEAQKDRLKQRSNVMSELISTELDYARDLQCMMELYIETLKENKILTKSQIDDLFSTVLHVLLKTSLDLFESLKRASQEGNVGATFLKYCEFFRIPYSTYCANQARMMTCLNNFKDIPGWQEFLKDCQATSRSKGLTIEMYLIKPVQRLTKYPLLLKELLKFTPTSDADYESLASAFAKIQEEALVVNERVSMLKNNDRVLAVQSTLEGYTADGGLLFQPHRRFVCEADFLKTMTGEKGPAKESHFFLFSDILLWAKKNYSSKYQYEEDWQLSSTLARDLPDNESLGHINAFEIVSMMKQKKIVVRAKTNDEKQTWLQKLELLVDENLKSEMRKITIQRLQKEKEMTGGSFRRSSPSSNDAGKQFLRIAVDKTVGVDLLFIAIPIASDKSTMLVSAVLEKVIHNVMKHLDPKSSRPELKLSYITLTSTNLLGPNDNIVDVIEKHKEDDGFQG